MIRRYAALPFLLLLLCPLRDARAGDRRYITAACVNVLAIVPPDLRDADLRTHGFQFSRFEAPDQEAIELLYAALSDVAALHPRYDQNGAMFSLRSAPDGRGGPALGTDVLEMSDDELARHASVKLVRYGAPDPELTDAYDGPPGFMLIPIKRLAERIRATIERSLFDFEPPLQIEDVQLRVHPRGSAIEVSAHSDKLDVHTDGSYVTVTLAPRGLGTILVDRNRYIATPAGHWLAVSGTARAAVLYAEGIRAKEHAAPVPDLDGRFVFIMRFRRARD